MTESSSKPILTSQFCFSTVALRDFLRLSRASIDDSITQNLNALMTPGNAAFDPSSTSRRSPRGGSRTVNPASCENFKKSVLFPSWQARSDVLAYCDQVATSPDPLDPDTLERQLEAEKDRERVVDDRLDPYSSRFFPNFEPRTEKLARTIRQEMGVEKIIRARSWALVVERCGSTTDDWEAALAEWQKGKNS